MGSGAKIALVALLILALIAIAKFVGSGKDDKSILGANQPAPPAGSPKKDGPRLVTPGTGGSTAPSTAQRPVISNRPATAGSAGNPGPGPVAASAGAQSSPSSPATASPTTSIASSAGGIAPSPSGGSGVPPASPTTASTPSATGSIQPIQQPGPIGNGAAGGTGSGPRPATSGGTPPRPIVGGIASAPTGPPPSGATISRTGEPSTAGAPPFRNLPTAPADGARATAPATSLVPAAVISSTGPVASPLSDSSSNPARSRSHQFPITHKLVSGDCYWQLAEDYYGAGKGGKLSSHIAAANRNANLIAGKTALIPAPPPETAPAPATASGSPAPQRPAATFVSSDERFNYYVVQPGDTLSGLAMRFLGSTDRIGSLHAANTRLKYEMLRAGMKIRIPK